MREFIKEGPGTCNASMRNLCGFHRMASGQKETAIQGMTVFFSEEAVKTVT